MSSGRVASMSEADGWVVLMECHDVFGLHALRATLEASGVPCQIHGENTHGIMVPPRTGGGITRGRALAGADERMIGPRACR